MLDGQTPQTVGGWIDYWAREAPDAPALVEEGRDPLTYEALARIGAQFRKALEGWGYGRNDRIAIVHPGGADCAAAIAAIWGCSTAVPLNPDQTVDEFAAYLGRLRVDALVAAEGVDGSARAAAERLGLRLLDLVRGDAAVAGSVALRGGTRRDARQPGPAAPGDLALALLTSGSTSRPKVVPVRHRELVVRATNMVDRLALTPNDRCLNLMPLFHANGLYTGLATNLVAGASVIVMPSFEPDTFFSCLRTLGPTWYSGAYTFQRRVAATASDHQDAVRRSRLRFIRSSSGRLDEPVLDTLEKAFRAPVIVTYATTETSHIAASPPEPKQRRRGTVGTSIGGELAIMGPAGELLPAGERGEVVARGPNVFEGYEDDADANAAAFHDGWFRTGDEGVLDADGYLTLTGRIKEIINRGGEKVSPAEVESVLNGHQEVVASAVFPIPHPTLGEEVAAAVVLQPWAGIDATHLARSAQRRLAPFKVPRKFVLVEEIPALPSGKVQRAGLAAAFGLDGSSENRAHPARLPERSPTPLEAHLATIWSRLLGLDRVGLDDDFFLLGGDSLQAVDLVLEIERVFGRSLPITVLYEAGTVAALAKRIETDTPLEALIAIHSDGDLPPLFCAPGRSENALVFRSLSRLLGPAQPFYGIRFGPLDREGMPFLDLHDMAAACVTAIREVQPDGPYYLAGYSFGGRLVYAMAQQLRREGQAVAFLGLFDTYLFGGPKRLSLRRRLAFNLAALSGMGPLRASRFVLERAGAFASKPLTSGRRRLYAAIRRRYVAWRWALPRFLADPEDIYLDINARTRLDRYDGPVVLFRASRGGRTPPTAYDGWVDLVGDGLEMVPMPGGHYDLLREPHVYTLVPELRRRLAHARARCGASADHEQRGD